MTRFHGVACQKRPEHLMPGNTKSDQFSDARSIGWAPTANERAPGGTYPQNRRMVYASKNDP